ncbi:MAG TPA: phage major capsid protein [Gemmatimonadales bacterium]|nr:phage major capsid protein [Gemmatimonadales bacterium]
MYETKIAELKSQAAEALSRANAIRTDALATGAFSAEQEANFQKAVADFEKFDKQWRALQAKEEQVAGIERASNEYLKPAERLATRSTASGTLQPEKLKEIHREAFRIYLSAGERLALEYLQRSGVPRESLSRFYRSGPREDVIQRIVDEGFAALGPTERHALVEGQGDLGGFLVPEDFQAELLKDLAGASVVLQAGATVRPTNRSEYVLPMFASGGTPADTYNTGFVGAYKPEGGRADPESTTPTTQSQPKSEQLRIPVHLWQPDVVVITSELLEDTPLALEAEILDVVRETRQLDYDKAFLKGTGNGEPEGVINSGASTVNTGAAANIAYNGLVNLFTKLASQYRSRPDAAFIMNSNTLAELLKLVDGQSRPLFPLNMMDLPEPRLWGKRIFFSEFLDDPTTASNKPIIFGAWSFYRVAERRDLRVQRLVEKYAPNVGILVTSRVGGKVGRKAAFKIQNVSA